MPGYKGAEILVPGEPLPVRHTQRLEVDGVQRVVYVPVGVEVLVADLYRLDHGGVLQNVASLSGWGRVLRPPIIRENRVAAGPPVDVGFTKKGPTIWFN